jgi:hypothetical protein
MILRLLALFSIVVGLAPNSRTLGALTGDVDLCDLLLVLTLPALYLYTRNLDSGPYAPVQRAVMRFALIATISTVSIPLRYGYPDLSKMAYCLTLLAKSACWTTHALLVARLVLSRREGRAVDAALVVGGLVTLGFFISQGGEGSVFSPFDLYWIGNSLGAGLACIAFGVLVRWLSGPSGDFRGWMQVVILLVLSAILTVSEARIALILLVAAIAGLAVFLRPAIGLTLVSALAAVSVAAASFIPAVQDTLRRTFVQTESYSGVETLDVDDGARIGTWLHEAPKLLDAPILGAGYFHRNTGFGSLSELWATGSHNYWLQMFLETGLLGGTAALLVVVELFKLRRLFDPRQRALRIGYGISVMLGFAISTTGEYLAGGFSTTGFFLGPALILAMLPNSPRPDGPQAAGLAPASRTSPTRDRPR